MLDLFSGAVETADGTAWLLVLFLVIVFAIYFGYIWLVQVCLNTLVVKFGYASLFTFWESFCVIILAGLFKSVSTVKSNS